MQRLSSVGGSYDVALSELICAVYDELRRLARYQLRRERPEHTLDSSALVHEAYLRLSEQRRVIWRNRTHFLAVASQAMRRVLVDYARAYRSDKRGGDLAKLSLDDALEIAHVRPPALLALDQALTDLASENSGLAKVVELRFFGGLTSEEIGEVLAVSVPTVTRRLRLARAWLSRQLLDDGGHGSAGQ